MSNPFFNKISGLLLEYFRTESVTAGDRYYLQLDRQDDVEGLLESFRLQSNVSAFVYKHEMGEPYETFAIEIQDVQLVVASTSDIVKPDFLVTLRNQVGEQGGVWKKTALLSVVSMQLDSIQGGSSDLQKEGMPLHAQTLVGRLKKEIENSTLNKVEQIMLLDRMDLILSEQIFQHITFFDFEEIFTLLAAGSIKEEDYKLLGLFKDDELDTFTGNKLRDRIELNRELFDFVKRFHDYGLDVEELENKFTSKGKDKLEKGNWSDTSFSDVLKHHNEMLEQRVKTKVELKSFDSKDDVIIWNRPVKETSAGERKRHIIIFNVNKKEEINLTATFGFEGGEAKSLQENYVRSKNSDVIVTVARTTMTIKVKTQTNGCTFAKVDYKHNNKPTLGAEFNILVLPIDSFLLDPYKTSYLIDTSMQLITIQYEGSTIVLGDGLNQNIIEINSDGQEILLNPDDKLIIEPHAEAFNDDEELIINIKLVEENLQLPIKLINELPESTPITGARIWRLKREMQRDFEWKSNKLMLGNREFYLNSDYRHFFEWETEWRERGYKCADFESGSLVNVDLELSDLMREAYSRYINQYNVIQNIPSLTVYSQELIKRAEEYLTVYVNEIKAFVSNKEAGRKGRDLFKLGVIKSNNCIYFTPYHPLIVAYQLQLNTQLSNEEVETNILNRLRPDGLVPFIYDFNDDDRLYKPDPQMSAMEWMVYKPVNQVSITDANKYLAKVIEDKLKQFEEHFGYLFSESSRAPLQINLINIENDGEVLRGIIQWMLRTIGEKGADALKNIELTLYRANNAESAFDRFSRLDSIAAIEEMFSINLVSKQYDSHDLMRIIRNKLNYYKQNVDQDYRYAHISFYKMMAQEKDALQLMSDMESGIALDGLYSFVPSMKSEENYRSGFGIKGYEIDDGNLLMETVYYINELAANLRNSGSDAYRKGESIFSRTTTADEKTLEKIFQISYWVTFIDSNIDLEFFNSYKNLVVIHYNDQYSTSNKYDAITVTDKSQQYYSVIKEVLAAKKVEVNEQSVINTVRAFNTFNGEWLLRIIGSKGHYSREKLSIISAIKFSLSYFDHLNILWVPISLEEILRVAGAVSLNKSEGVFTAKNLGVKGAHSDDLLLIGLEERKGQLVMHFYPVEVKIGINNGSVLDKAKAQVKHTKQLIISALSENSEKRFTSRFYRYFFVQLYITNAYKLYSSEFWPQRIGYNLSFATIERLLKDDLALDSDIHKIIGEGAVLSFQRDAYHRSSKLEDGITYLNLTEDDGYSGLTKSMEDMRHWIQDKNNDFIKERMLSYLYNYNGESPIESRPTSGSVLLNISSESTSSLEPPVEPTELKESVEALKSPKGLIESIESIEQPTLPEESMTPVDPPTMEIKKLVDLPRDPEGPLCNQKPVKADLQQARILLGRAENSNRELYWEFGHKDLANRHLLISGKSGQGKTYLMQCLLLEQSKLGISNIVIDYTEGFLPNQLESEFVNFMGAKLTQRIVFTEKFPINPFRKNVRDIGGAMLPEDNTDVAERVKSVFGTVYKSLGIQQLNAIYEAVLNGLEAHDEKFNLPLLKEALEADNSSYSKTALSQIRPFIDRNPFANEDSMEWTDLFEGDGNVFIIQLTGYPRDVQLILTEFILWDLWNHSVRNGRKNNPIPVVLDEAQNLDHGEKSPSTKILTEGRKFGWSGWFATQFLKAQLGNDELARLQNASQKIYFAQPEQEISYIASNLANDQSEKKKIEQRLAALKKGQCIVNGQSLKENGELSSPVVTVIDITPLKYRI
ncbi:DNA phosphorothioation-dependent restriction protein DptH [Paenibacillus sp. Soil766]|uniref:DNA phosphorothioation-dependent restriction protein DptH n=1 Tax=Paenibacillus sp. Soil766 TaxID=1736404 RepID=UPI00070F63CE|nr:DNA phosphorothioation-dependent restriction protein DptH [Paenibacillus sp. Soil766]KRF01092.1 DNA phosphorothioation-dependent restriction protein DptH [Paenibacillus sp. Soil766]